MTALNRWSRVQARRRNLSYLDRDGNVTVTLRRSVAGCVVCNAYECLCNRQKGVGGHIIQAVCTEPQVSWVHNTVLDYSLPHGRARRIESTWLREVAVHIFQLCARRRSLMIVRHVAAPTCRHHTPPVPVPFTRQPLMHPRQPPVSYASYIRKNRQHKTLKFRNAKATNLCSSNCTGCLLSLPSMTLNSCRCL